MPRRLLAALLVFLLVASAAGAEVPAMRLLRGGVRQQRIALTAGLPAGWVFSRASTATYMRSGALLTAAVNAPRFETDAAGTPLGYLNEPQSTNGLLNNSMVGAVASDVVELCNNGTFTGAAGAGWIAGGNGGTGSVDFSTTGRATLTGDGVNPASIDQSFQTVAGLIYNVRATFSAGGGISVGTVQSGNSLANRTAAAGAESTVQFVASGATTWLRLYRVGVTPTVVTGISVQVQLALNGNFALSPLNAAQNTLQNGWQWSAGGTSTVTWNGSSSITLTGDGTNAVSATSAPITTVVGVTYTISVDMTASTSSVKVGTSAGGGTLLATTPASPGAGLKFQFTATTTTSFLTFGKTNAVSVTISNVSVQSAGVLPTGWIRTAGSAGVPISVVGTGTELGIPYVDLQLVGTPIASGAAALLFCNGITIPAATGAAWTASTFIKVAAGSLTNVGIIKMVVQENDGAGNYLLGSTATLTVPTTGALSSYRPNVPRTNNQATTAYEQASLTVAVTNGQPVNVTFRIGAPQVETLPFASSTILTSTIAATRAADDLLVPLALYPWWQTRAGESLSVDYTTLGGVQGGAQLVDLGDTTVSNRANLTLGNSNNINASLVVGGVTVNSGVGTMGAVGTAEVAALSITPAGMRVSLNGAEPVAFVNANFPKASRLAIGRSSVSASGYGAFQMRALTLRAGPASGGQLRAMP